MWGRKAAEISVLRADLLKAQHAHTAALLEIGALKTEMGRRAEQPVVPGADWAVIGSDAGVMSFRIAKREDTREALRMLSIPINPTTVARVPEVTRSVKLIFTDFTQIVYGERALAEPHLILQTLAAEWKRKL